MSTNLKSSSTICQQGVGSGRIPARDSMNGSDAEASFSEGDGVNLGVSNPNSKNTLKGICKKCSTTFCLG
jgi:hypothetical protein